MSSHLLETSFSLTSCWLTEMMSHNTTTSMTKTDIIRVLKHHLWQQVTKQREDQVWDKCYFVRVLLTDSTGTKHVPKVFIHDFLKKLVSDDCLAALFLTSAQVFLIIFFAGEGCFSFSVGLIL